MDERDEKGNIILKSKFENFAFHILMCFVWGLTTSVIIIGFPLFIIDEIFGTYTMTILDNGIFGGEVWFRFFKIFLIGIPLHYLTTKYK